MGVVSRAVWSGLLLDHPAVDLADPPDAFAEALIGAAGGDAAAWTDGTETEAFEAYSAALGEIPDSSWARDALHGAPQVYAEVTLCLELGIPYSEFLAWDARSQDLALEAAFLRRDTCARGHARELMADPGASKVVRVHCAACEQSARMEKALANAPEDLTLGWSTEVHRT